VPTFSDSRVVFMHLLCLHRRFLWE